MTCLDKMPRFGRPYRITGVAAFGLAAATVLAAEPGTGWPAPGEYRIDSEATFSPRGGPPRIQTVQKVDGRTGATTVTQLVDGQATGTQTYPGTGPRLHCVTAAAPPVLPATNCSTALSSTAGGGQQYDTQCPPAIGLQGRWRRIDASQWEHVFHVEQQPAAAAGAPPAALMDQMLARMPPAERAKAAQAMAALPTPAQRRAALEQTLAQMEAAAREAPPEEAAQIRQQMAMMQGAPGGKVAGSFIWDVSERWTRVRDHCSGAEK